MPAPDGLPPADWPNRSVSRIVRCRPHQWHVQEMGEGATILLIHGAGGATHSWRDVLPDLAVDHHVVALDLPGHGFTRLGTRSRSGLVGMAEDIAALCHHEGWLPQAIIGHSAGAAIALQMALEHPAQVRTIVGLNAALGHFEGIAGWLFPFMAKALALNPLTARVVAATSSEKSVARLLESTGSAVDAEMQRHYASVVKRRDHVDGALLMMASWSLDRLLLRMNRLELPVLFLTGDSDGAVPPSVSENAAKSLGGAEVVSWRGLGHLMHEEAPQEVCARIRTHLRNCGVAG